MKLTACPPPPCRLRQAVPIAVGLFPLDLPTRKVPSGKEETLERGDAFLNSSFDFDVVVIYCCGWPSQFGCCFYIGLQPFDLPIWLSRLDNTKILLLCANSRTFPSVCPVPSPNLRVRSPKHRQLPRPCRVDCRRWRYYNTFVLWYVLFG